MQFDIVIFGASGFTGKKVVEEISRGRAKYAGVTWAVAGRSEAKLQSLLSDISAKYGVVISGIKIIIADVSDQSSLTSMCRQAKVLLNCCGPYRLYGEPVVRAAIEAKAHYVDITGEEDVSFDRL
ncbi:lipid droplet localized protein-like [Ostrinia furnacalis]|uniref:lipid droplet localized protein-like n=1 Tax=Ostrinia furnacalis TaxID=93504 RepID=UPI00103D849B|nr:lipid droplet localized protein-like [Ostrinia furnacalis]